MSSIVTILPDRQGIQCTVGAQSRLSFRVVNESGRFRKVGAQILAEPGQLTWLAIQGDSERYLSQAGETTFEVAVSVPPGAEPGRHRFQLLVFDSAEPGEWFDESSAVALEVVAQAVSPPPPPPAAQVMRRSWWVTSGVSLAVAIGSLIAMFAIAVMIAPERGTFLDEDDDKFAVLFALAAVASAVIAGITTRFAYSWWLVAFGSAIASVSSMFGLALVVYDFIDAAHASRGIVVALVSFTALLAGHLYLCRRAGASRRG